MGILHCFGQVQATQIYEKINLLRKSIICGKIAVESCGWKLCGNLFLPSLFDFTLNCEATIRRFDCRYYRPEELHCGRLATHLHNEIFESNLSDENEISSVRICIMLLDQIKKLIRCVCRSKENAPLCPWTNSIGSPPPKNLRTTSSSAATIMIPTGAPPLLFLFCHPNEQTGESLDV